MSGHFLKELRTTFAAQPGRTAIEMAGQTLSYGELGAMAARCAGWLQGQGVEPGDRVAIATPAKLPFLAAHLGTLYAGAISLPVNPRLTRDELNYLLADSGAKLVVSGPDNDGILASLSGELPELRAVVRDEMVWNAPETRSRLCQPAGDAGCLMLYSSGTTGRPKGVLHRHANLSASLRALRACWRFSPEDVLLNVLPLFHIHGLSFATHLALLSGATLRLEESFHPRRTLEAIGECTVFMAIPTFYYAFLERPEFRALAAGWTRTRLFTCGSAPIRPEVLPVLEAILGKPVINRYGMTEGHVITSLPLDGPWPSGSVGRPLEGIEVRLVHDGGANAPAGSPGSVQIRGPNLFREYWRNPEATRAAFASGWFDTGDLGTRDTAGFLTLVGRKHDLIITSGLNVYPQVVERAINECPGVRESVVLGVPDARRGERVVAVVVRSDPTLDDRRLKEFLSDRLIDYQRPSLVVFADALPRNALGKVLRREVRTWFSRPDSPAGP